MNSIGLSGTTIISDNKSPALRRVFWLCLIFAMFGVMIWQIIERFKLYFSGPVAVNFEYVYEDQARFPVLVICNVNLHTISGTYGMNEVSENGSTVNMIRQLNVLLNTMELLDKTDASPIETVKTLHLLYGPEFDAEVSMSSIEVYSRTGSHKLKHMLKRCYWQNQPCSVHDFKIITEPYSLKQCYAFNSNKTLYTSSPGSEGGLHLLLDSQQYEYAMARSTFAGFYVSLFDDIMDINSSMTGAAIASAGNNDILFQIKSHLMVHFARLFYNQTVFQNLNTLLSKT